MASASPYDMVHVKFYVVANVIWIILFERPVTDGEQHFQYNTWSWNILNEPGVPHYWQLNDNCDDIAKWSPDKYPIGIVGKD